MSHEILTGSEFVDSRIRISIAALCRLRLPDGRYVFQYNPDRNLVKPLGGACKYTDLSLWSAIGFELEDPQVPDDQDDLRGTVPSDKVPQLLGLCRSGQGREADTPYRELNEELFIPLGIVPAGGLPGRFVRSEIAGFDGPSAAFAQGSLTPTLYYFEIYSTLKTK